MQILCLAANFSDRYVELVLFFIWLSHFFAWQRDTDFFQWLEWCSLLAINWLDFASRFVWCRYAGSILSEENKLQLPTPSKCQVSLLEKKRVICYSSRKVSYEWLETLWKENGTNNRKKRPTSPKTTNGITSLPELPHQRLVSVEYNTRFHTFVLDQICGNLSRARGSVGIQ